MKREDEILFELFALEGARQNSMQYVARCKRRIIDAEQRVVEARQELSAALGAIETMERQITELRRQLYDNGGLK